MKRKNVKKLIEKVIDSISRKTIFMDEDEPLSVIDPLTNSVQVLKEKSCYYCKHLKEKETDLLEDADANENIKVNIRICEINNKTIDNNICVIDDNVCAEYQKVRGDKNEKNIL